MTAEATRQQRQVALLLALTFVTGVADAVGYLAFDHIFTGNMTGNFVFIAFAVAGTPVTTTPWGPVAAVAGFSIGALVVGRVLRDRPRRWTHVVTTLFVIGATMLASVAFATLVHVGESNRVVFHSILATVVAVEMGMQAMVARHLNVKDMTTVVVTSTLTSAMGESLVGRKNRVINRRFAAILAIVVGAIVGAALLRFATWIPLMLSAILTLVVAFLGREK